MPVLKTTTVTSIKGFVEYLEGAYSGSAWRTRWFRGSGLADQYKLVPSLFRNTAYTAAEHVVREKNILSTFQLRQDLHAVAPSGHDMEWLFFMQHHAIPTRLLDWTVNPMVALSFSLAQAEADSSKAGPDEGAAIWMLDPEAWNNHAWTLLRVTPETTIPFPGDVGLKGYNPVSEPTVAHAGLLKTMPLAIYGTTNSGRIRAQQGSFVLFGCDSTAVEDRYLADNFPDDCLEKIVVDKAVLAEVRKTVLAMGFGESFLYPDIEGIAKQIRREFGV